MQYVTLKMLSHASEQPVSLSRSTDLTFLTYHLILSSLKSLHRTLALKLLKASMELSF